MKNNGAGKGDTYRPVNKQRYDENYERIFRGGEKKLPQVAENMRQADIIEGVTAPAPLKKENNYDSDQSTI